MPVLEKVRQEEWQKFIPKRFRTEPLKPPGLTPKPDFEREETYSPVMGLGAPGGLFARARDRRVQEQMQDQWRDRNLVRLGSMSEDEWQQAFNRYQQDKERYSEDQSEVFEFENMARTYQQVLESGDFLDRLAVEYPQRVPFSRLAQLIVANPEDRREMEAMELAVTRHLADSGHMRRLLPDLPAFILELKAVGLAFGVLGGATGKTSKSWKGFQAWWKGLGVNEQSRLLRYTLRAGKSAEALGRKLTARQLLTEKDRSARQIAEDAAGNYAWGVAMSPLSWIPGGSLKNELARGGAFVGGSSLLSGVLGALDDEEKWFSTDHAAGTAVFSTAITMSGTLPKVPGAVKKETFVRRNLKPLKDSIKKKGYKNVDDISSKTYREALSRVYDVDQQWKKHIRDIESRFAPEERAHIEQGMKQLGRLQYLTKAHKDAGMSVPGGISQQMKQVTDQLRQVPVMKDYYDTLDRYERLTQRKGALLTEGKPLSLEFQNELKAVEAQLMNNPYYQVFSKGVKLSEAMMAEKDWVTDNIGKTLAKNVEKDAKAHAERGVKLLREPIKTEPSPPDITKMSATELAKAPSDIVQGQQHMISVDTFQEIGIHKNYTFEDGKFYNILADGSLGREATPQELERVRDNSREAHRFMVRQAIGEGIKVPEDVMKDYPDLASQEPPDPDVPTPEALEKTGWEQKYDAETDPREKQEVAADAARKVKNDSDAEVILHRLEGMRKDRVDVRAVIDEIQGLSGFGNYLESEEPVVSRSMADQLDTEASRVIKKYSIFGIDPDLEVTEGIDPIDMKIPTDGIQYKGKKLPDMTDKELKGALKAFETTGGSNKAQDQQILAYVMTVFPEKPAILKDIREAMKEPETDEKVEISRGNVSFAVPQTKEALGKLLKELRASPTTEELITVGIKEKSTPRRHTQGSPNLKEIGNVIEFTGEGADQWLSDGALLIKHPPTKSDARRPKAAKKHDVQNAQRVMDKAVQKAEPAVLEGFYMHSPDIGEAISHTQIPDKKTDRLGARPFVWFGVGDKYIQYRQAYFNKVHEYLNKMDGDLSYGVNAEMGQLVAYKDGEPVAVLSPVADRETKQAFFDELPFKKYDEKLFFKEQPEEHQPDEVPVETKERPELETLADEYSVSWIEDAHSEVVEAQEMARATGKVYDVSKNTDPDAPFQYEVHLEGQPPEPADKWRRVAQVQPAEFDELPMEKTIYPSENLTEWSSAELIFQIQHKDAETGHARNFTQLIDHYPEEKPYLAAEVGDKVVNVPQKGMAHYAEDVKKQFEAGAIGTIVEKNHISATVLYPDQSEYKINYEHLAKVKDGVRMPEHFGGKSLGAAQMPDPPPSGISNKQHKMIMALAKKKGLIEKDPETGELDHSKRYEFLRAWTGETSIKNLGRQQAGVIIDRLLQMPDVDDMTRVEKQAAWDKEMDKAETVIRESVSDLPPDAPEDAISKERQAVLRTLQENLPVSLWSDLTSKYGEPVYADPENYMPESVAKKFEIEAHRRWEQHNIKESAEDLKRNAPDWYNEYKRALDAPGKRPPGKLPHNFSWRPVLDVMERIAVEYDMPEIVPLFYKIWSGNKLGSTLEAEATHRLVKAHGYSLINRLNHGKDHERLVGYITGKHENVTPKERAYADDLAKELSGVIPYVQYGKIKNIVLHGYDPADKRHGIGDYEDHKKEIDRMVHYARTRGLQAFKEKYGRKIEAGEVLWGTYENYWPQYADTNKFTQDTVTRMLDPDSEDIPDMEIAPGVNVRQAPLGEFSDIGLLETFQGYIRSMVSSVEFAEPMSSLLSVLVEDVAPKIENVFYRKQFIMDLNDWTKVMYRGRGYSHEWFDQAVGALRRIASAPLIHWNPFALLRNCGQWAANDPVSVRRVATAKLAGYKPTAEDKQWFDTYTRQLGELAGWVSPEDLGVDVENRIAKGSAFLVNKASDFAELVNRYSWYPKTDTFCRYMVFYGNSWHYHDKLDKTQTPQEFVKKAGLEAEHDPGVRAEALRLLHSDGEDAMVRFLTQMKNFDINHDYSMAGRSFREIREQGDRPRKWDLFLWTARQVNRIMKRLNRGLAPDASLQERLAAFRYIGTALVAHEMVGWGIDKIAGRRRRTYRPGRILTGYGIGGLDLAVIDAFRRPAYGTLDAMSGDREAIDALMRSVIRGNEMLLPPYRLAIGAMEGLFGKTYIDRYVYRGAMEKMWEEYERNTDWYDRSEATIIERMQRMLFGRDVYMYDPMEREAFWERILRDKFHEWTYEPDDEEIDWREILEGAETSQERRLPEAPEPRHWK